MTSYQANFASRHTRHRHVGFLFTCERIGKSNKMFHYFLFSSYHITKLQPSDKNINTHTQMKFQILPWNKSKVLAFFVIFSIPRCATGNQGILQNRARVKCVPRRANPLYPYMYLACSSHPQQHCVIWDLCSWSEGSGCVDFFSFFFFSIL